MPRDLYLSQLVDLSQVAGSARLLRPSVGPARDAIFLLASESAAEVIQGRYEQPGWASFADSRTRDPADAQIVIHNGRQVVRRVAVGELQIAHPHLQPLPREDVLVVGARCFRFQDGSAEQNARVYSAEGELLREFVLGDGIQDLQVTSTGHIWVSYFDEGIFGNYGWSEPIGRVCDVMGAGSVWRHADLPVLPAARRHT
jgi:hypothetical protein